jgi:adenylate cyclase
MKKYDPPDARAIFEQLEKITESADFRGADRQKGFLSYIVTETLSGRAEQIKGYTIALAVYGRSEDFDPQVDPIVRVAAGRLRRALDHYYLAEGVNDPVLIEIPKGSYHPRFCIRETRQPENTHPEKTTREPIQDFSIAVLPILNLTLDKEKEYFADGLTEELTAELARYQDFVVIASQSSLHFKGKQLKHQDIGQELGARFLLEGSIRSDDMIIKVTIKLIDSPTAQQLFSSSYKRTLTASNLIALQEEIAQEVVGVIADQFGAITRRLALESRKKIPTTLQAYDAVLRFYHFESTLSVEAFKTVLAALTKAVEQDPDYALAWSMLGHLYADNHALGFCQIDSSLDKAFNCARRGLTLNPENQFAHDALALVYFHRNEKVLFFQHVRQTIALNPNAPYIIGVAGWHMALCGEWDEGITLLRRGMLLNPRYPSWFHLALYCSYYVRGEYESAYSEALKFNFPELFWDQVMRASALSELNREEEAKKVVGELLKFQPIFAENGRQLICHYVKVKPLVEKICEGLDKVGLTILK